MGIHSTTWYRPRVKFCGLTRSQDADFAADAGVDIIGLVQVSASARYVDLERAAVIADAVRGRVLIAQLFMDPDEHSVRDAVSAVSPDLLQFHGAESAAFCQQFRLPWIKALGVRGLGADQLLRLSTAYADASYLLIDGHAPGEQGGSGHQVSATLQVPVERRRLMLAGGLDAHTVGPAIEHFRPACVDVSSGIESRPGVKDHHRMQAFLHAVEQAAIACRRHQREDS